ncbi:MAG TPA: hypothetical protein VFX59_31815, partial [Polyangiales bacterium]|nr:hypothetical protein [Polyangiales bacterium]
MSATTKICAISLAILFAACGDGDGPKRRDDDGGSNPRNEAGTISPDPDAGRDAEIIEDARIRDARVEVDTGPGCKTACAGDDCLQVPDNCGGFLTCNPCEGELVCGLKAPNKCGAPDPVSCTPKTAAELCAGKCGAVSDTCSSVVTCDAAAGGVTCGANQACTNGACVDTISPCVALTCTSKMHQCGDDGDGCGGILHCGDCSTGKQCMFASTGNSCQDVPPPQCTPLLPAMACPMTCGTVSDGCGGTIRCQDLLMYACPNGTACTADGAAAPTCKSTQVPCTPKTAAVVCDGKCGPQPDGCGTAIDCSASNGGQTCNATLGESCGGGGVPSQCGKEPCVPKTQAELCPVTGGNKACGKQPDGCGTLVDCGGCATDQQCGLFASSVCGTIPVCQPTAVATACASKCGTVPDGCGGSYNCSSSNGGVSCSGSEYCGANGMANKCGAPPVTCTPKTCAQLGHSCGLASDGCGHVLNCWPSCNANDPSCSGTCSANSACLANQTTAAQSCVSGGPTCTGSLCNSVPASCPANTTSKLTGTVVTPGRTVNGAAINRLPVPNAIVYIPAEPSAALPSFVEGVIAGNSASCGRCEDEKLVADGQSVLAAGVTNYKGEFTLEGRIPVGVAFKLVLKVGKWRRVVNIDATVAKSCQTVALTTEQTRLNANTTDGLTGTHLPKIAISTGDVDAMECVLLGMGISQSEFTLPSGSGRVQMFRANGTMMPSSCSGGTTCTNNNNRGCRNGNNGCSFTNADTNLYASQAALNAYDLVVFDCEGEGHYARNSTQRTRLLDYVNNGGRVFASHWAYEWLDNTGTLDMAAAWNANGSATTGTAFVSLPSGTTQRAGANGVKSPLFRDWLTYQGALSGTAAGQTTAPTTPQMGITDPRDVAGSTVGTSTDEWMYRRPSNTSYVQQLSFNTPYGAAESAICGRVAFTAFHVASSTSSTTLSTDSTVWPAECSTNALTPQEKTLAFMLFDLATCVSTGDPPQPPACVPKTVAQVCPGVNDACGYVSDGCGGVVDCAGCAAGFYCDGNACRPQQCTPATCSSLGFTCGNHADGCGGIARNAQGQEGCGTCTNGQTCGLTQAGFCGGCVQVPQGTACPAGSCGTVSNGCGGTYDCGLCTAPNTCGGGGPNKCGPGSCSQIPQATACQGKTCGVVADGCGGSYTCGTCTAPNTCGGGGSPNVCGQPTCTPKTLQQVCSGLQCGWVSDGCGGAINCGTCPNGGQCGGNGPNQCGATCQPTTCTAANADCGNIADLCGSLLNCGTCPAGQVCGATTPNRCGPGTACTPRTCAAANAQCGLIGDGCGSVLDCGVCTSPQTCGGGGTANV